MIRIQPAHDVSGTSPEGSLKVLTSGTYSEISGDQYKNWWFYEKLFFRSYSPCIVSVFYKKNKYSKVLNGDVHGTQLRDILRTKWWDVLGTSLKHVSWIHLTNTVNLLWQITQDFIVNGSWEKFSELWLKK